MAIVTSVRMHCGWRKKVAYDHGDEELDVERIERKLKLERGNATLLSTQFTVCLVPSWPCYISYIIPQGRVRFGPKPRGHRENQHLTTRNITTCSI
jgi:hypothetical protein